MGRKNSPGCKCCGPKACNTAPFCLASVPAAAYVGDGFGTHTMNLITGSSTNTFAIWESAIYNAALTTYKFSPGGDFCTVDAGAPLQIRYQFSLNCATASGPNQGKITASFRKLFLAQCCGSPGPPFNVLLISGTPPINVIWAVNTGPIHTCADTVFDFTLPDPIFLPACSATVPMPGGGGIYSVTF